MTEDQSTRLWNVVSADLTEEYILGDNKALDSELKFNPEEQKPNILKCLVRCKTELEDIDNKNILQNLVRFVKPECSNDLVEGKHLVSIKKEEPWDDDDLERKLEQFTNDLKNDDKKLRKRKMTSDAAPGLKANKVHKSDEVIEIDESSSDHDREESCVSVPMEDISEGSEETQEQPRHSKNASNVNKVGKNKKSAKKSKKAIEINESSHDNDREEICVTKHTENISKGAEKTQEQPDHSKNISTMNHRHTQSGGNQAIKSLELNDSRVRNSLKNCPNLSHKHMIKESGEEMQKEISDQLTKNISCEEKAKAGAIIVVTNLTADGKILDRDDKPKLNSAPSTVFDNKLSDDVLESSELWLSYIIKEKEDILELHVCKICDKVLSSRKSLNRHSDTHSDLKKYVCPTCGKAYKTQDNLKCHEQMIHCFESVNCSECGKLYGSRKALKNHFYKVHKVVKFESCDLCEKVYKKKEHLNRHKLVKHSIGYNPTLKYICDHCSSEFGTKEKLKSHIFSLHLPPMFQCKECLESFTSYSKLYIHLRNAHSIDNRSSYICEICGKVFKSEKNFKRHILTHGNEFPFVCEECGKCFRTESNLEQHSRTHSDVRPFTCDVCDKSFRIRHHLRQHMAVHGMVSTPRYGKRARKISSSSNNSATNGSTDESCDKQLIN